MAGTFSHRGMLGFDTVATKSHHHQPVNATTLVLGWKLVTALGINEIEHLDACLTEAKRALASRDELDWELLVADNGSDNGSVELALTHAGVRVVAVSIFGAENHLMGVTWILCDKKRTIGNLFSRMFHQS